MTCFKNMFGAIVLLFLFFPFELQAGITFSSRTGNVTYWSLGSTVRLPWDYDFKESDVLSESFDFIASGSTTRKSLATIGKTTTKDPRVTITDKATLSFPGAQLSDNGTYTFKVTVNLIGLQSHSVLVIILDQPTAKASCSGEGDNASCLCKGIGGNPPAYATWLKGNTKIKGPEYLSTTIVKKNITLNGEGEYTCKANSFNLTDEASVNMSKPKEISFKAINVGGETKLVCKVVGTINPAPVYFISFNGSAAKKYENGVKDIVKVDSRSIVGQYECLAKNILGNATEQFFFNGTAPVSTTTRPTTSHTTSSNSTKDGDDGEDGDDGSNTGAIVGAVIGGLLLIILVVALVYWFGIKKNECCCVIGGKDDRSEEGRSQNENPAGGYGLEDNQYASVDEGRARADKGASTSRNQAKPAAEMPPVYAAVDKTKKTKKPPPDAQPSLTYASLDPVILQPDSSNMRDRAREETNYATIDLEKLQSDLV